MINVTRIDVAGITPYFTGHIFSGVQIVQASEGFWAMGGHGAYIWPSYGIVALVLIGLAVVTIRALRATERELRDAEKTARETRNET